MWQMMILMREKEPTELDSKISDMVEKAKENLEAGGAELVDISQYIPESLITSLRQAAPYANVFMGI